MKDWAKSLIPLGILMLLTYGVLNLGKFALVWDYTVGIFSQTVGLSKDETKQDRGYLDIKELTGKLKVQLNFVDSRGQEDGNALFDRSVWIYINKQIVKKLERPLHIKSSKEIFEIKLIPGDYQVEVVFLKRANYQIRRLTADFSRPVNSERQTHIISETPFFAGSAKIKIYGGEVTENFWNLKSPVTDSIGRPRVIERGVWSSWIEWQEAAFKRMFEDYQQSKTLPPLFDVAAAFQKTPPFLPSVYVNFRNEDLAGPREIDAEMIKIILFWHKNKYWSEFFHLTPEDTRGMPASVRRRYLQLEAQLNQILNDINLLEGIAVKLKVAEH